MDENVASGDLANHAIWLVMHLAEIHHANALQLRRNMPALRQLGKAGAEFLQPGQHPLGTFHRVMSRT